MDPMISLTSEEEEMLHGGQGPALPIVMRILSKVAPIYGATYLQSVTSTHIDGCIYSGDTGLAFVERLAELGGQVRVPSTLNVMSMDRDRWQHGSSGAPRSCRRRS